MAHARLDGLLHALAESDGSDLHIKVGSPPRIRVHGVLRKVAGEEVLRPADTKEMAEAIMRPDVAERFQGAADADFAYSVPGVGRFRANAFRQRGSVALVFRRVRTSAASFGDLGLPEVVGRLALEHRGLVLVTGPTGSGKTTTLAAMIDHINSTRECHVITIEDPIEVLHADKLAAINQREIGVDAESFAQAMRASMRQDPDVILVGEMRDEETVAAALSALAVEPVPSRRGADDAFVANTVYRLQELTAQRRIAEVKSRLQRTNPVEQTTEYNRMFGELTALEQQRRQLRDLALGAS